MESAFSVYKQFQSVQEKGSKVANRKKQRNKNRSPKKVNRKERNGVRDFNITLTGTREKNETRGADRSIQIVPPIAVHESPDTLSQLSGAPTVAMKNNLNESSAKTPGKLKRNRKKAQGKIKQSVNLSGFQTSGSENSVKSNKGKRVENKKKKRVGKMPQQLIIESSSDSEDDETESDDAATAKKIKMSPSSPSPPPFNLVNKSPSPSVINNAPPTAIEDHYTECVTLFRIIIHPIKTGNFFDKYWEKTPVHLPRKNPNYFQKLFTSSELDFMIRENPLYYTRNVDVVSYERGVKQVFNQEGRAVPSALWDSYANGCSIRVLNPQTYNKKLHMLVVNLQEYFGSMVGVNVYLTPPSSQGFAPHYDDIEAFILQIEGRKHWKLYQPKDADILARDSSPNLTRDAIGDPFMEMTLEAGDLLYFPRGTIHEGRTDHLHHSLHITVSVYQHNSYADLLEKAIPEALKRAAIDDVNFRKGLPVQFLKHVGLVNHNREPPSTTRSDIVKTVETLMTTLSGYVKDEIDDAADQLGRRLMRDSMPPVLTLSETGRTVRGDGDYLKDGKVLNRVEIGPDTKVRLLRYHCVRLTEEADGLKLYYCTENAPIYHGEEEQFLDIDDGFREAVTLLQGSYPSYVSVESLPIDDEISKVQFAVDLWERGLLVTDEPLMEYPFNDDSASTSSTD